MLTNIFTVEGSKGPLSKDYPKDSQEHKWILEGMQDYYLRDKTIASQYVDFKQSEESGRRVIEEFVDSMKGANKELIKKNAYKAIGQLFVEIEQKHLPRADDKGHYKGDLSLKIDNHFLKLIETPKDTLREQMRELLVSKIKKLKPKKNPKAKGKLVEQDEFIGEDEVITTTFHTEEVSEVTVIPSPEYTAKDLGCKYSLCISISNMSLL